VITGNISFFLYVDVQCVKLVPSSDELEMLCDNGTTYTTGEVYAGDICFMSCSTGYELSGSDARTCQSDGSWSGTESTCRRGRVHNAIVWW